MISVYFISHTYIHALDRKRCEENAAYYCFVLRPIARIHCALCGVSLSMQLNVENFCSLFSMSSVLNIFVQNFICSIHSSCIVQERKNIFKMNKEVGMLLPKKS